MAQTIILTNGASVLVDDEDYPWLARYSWYEINGYAYRWCRIGPCKGHEVAMHREIAQADPRLSVHHRDENRLNNQRANLTCVTVRDHSREHLEAITRASRNQLPRRNRSGFKGVSWSPQLAKWQVALCVNGRNLYFGYWDDPEEAALIYDAAVLHYKGGEGYLNLLPHPGAPQLG